MLYLRYGDILPSVGIAQRLINKCRNLDSRLAGVPKIEEDGIYLRGTRDTVRTVQRALNIFPHDGVFGPSLWRVLADMAKWRIVDICDVTVEGEMGRFGRYSTRERLISMYRQRNPGASVLQAERATDTWMHRYDSEISNMRTLVDRLKSKGGRPIELRSLDLVYQTIRRGIAARSNGGWEVVIIRFQAHGRPGHQGVAGSMFGRVGIEMEDLSIDPGDSFNEILQTLLISGSVVPMARFGIVELHGCNIAAIRRDNRLHGSIGGPAYVQAFANCVGRPVSACAGSNDFGDIQSDVRLEPPVVSSIPGGGSTKQWFTSR